MKIRSVRANHRKKAFEIRTGNRLLGFPFAKADPPPAPDDPVGRAYADPEIGREGFTYVLKSGRTGTIHVEQVLDYNRDPAYLRDLLVHNLTVEALKRLKTSQLSTRELIRRLETSASQFYRLLDTSNTRKTVDSMLALLQVLDCDVDLVVRAKTA